MENFIFGIGAIARSISFGIKAIIQNQLFWGFAIGFLVSTLIHSFLISDKLKNICTSWINKKKKNNGTPLVSFKGWINKTKFIFTLALFLFMVVVLMALLMF